MVELQIINKLLKERSLSFIRDNDITELHFSAYRPHYTTIINHYSNYGNVPDVPTFLTSYPDFELIDVTESDKYLVETIREHYLYAKLVPFVNEVAERLRKDSTDAIEFAKAGIDTLSKITAAYGGGYDIVLNADDRRDEYKNRSTKSGLLGISSGIKELDDITHGWLPEDLITIVGRTNEGKSWVLMYLLVMAWYGGKTVLLYSGEMSNTTVGFRFDTLAYNFSNDGLMRGLKELGGGLTDQSYYDYLDAVKSGKVSPARFIVVTPKDLGGRRLDVPKLHSLIEQYKPDIIGIDQLSLMSDYRAGRGEQERLKYTHIAEDLYLTSERYGVPIITPAQASRESVKSKSKERNSEDAPELHQIAESDGVGQNSTRVLSIKQLGATMKISIKKNRYGRNNQDLLLLWDIDRGIVKPFLHVDAESGRAELTTKDGEDLF
jgi:replicative DNA helicase